jgi:hypothetical protein
MSSADLESPLEKLKPKRYRIHPLLESISIAVVIFIATFSTVYFVFDRALYAQEGEIRQGLLRTAHVAASVLDVDQHGRFDNDELRTQAEFQAAVRPLVLMQRSDPQIAYLYTLVKRGAQYHFVFDSTQSLQFPPDGEDAVQIMQVYEDALNNEAMLRAFETEKPTTSNEAYSDEFGRFISGYVPLRDAEGKFRGVLGMDIDVKDYEARLAPIRRATVRAQVTGFFIAFLMGATVWFLRNFIQVVNDKRQRVFDLFKLALTRTIKKTGSDS